MKELIAELKAHKISLSLNEDELVLDYVGDDLSENLITRIKENKSEIVAYLSKYQGKSDYVEIPNVRSAKNYAISSGQKRLWMLSQFEEITSAYNIFTSVFFDDKIDIENFKRAIQASIERHEILRTVFKKDENGEVRQWPLKVDELGFEIDFQDFSELSDSKAEVQSYIKEDSFKLFDLENGPLLRASLIRVAANHYIFYYNMHHIISDGWSMKVLSNDVMTFYEAYCQNKVPRLANLNIQYKDYAAWQINQIESDNYNAHKTFWLERLVGELPLLDLPIDKQRPRIKTNNGRNLSTFIDVELNTKLKDFSRSNNGSLFMTLLAGWNVLMYRYTGQKDIVIGTPIAGREHADLQNQIGFYVNTLALRNQIIPAESFIEFYRQLKENTLKSYKHQMYPFDQLVEDLNVQRDTSRNPIFDIFFILQNNSETPNSAQLNEVEYDEISDKGFKTSQFDIDITFYDQGNYLSIELVYNPDVYEGEMVKNLLRHYKQLLHVILENPEGKIAEYDFLSASEKNQLLTTFNDTEVAYPKQKALVELIEEQVERTPQNVALIFQDETITYQELNEQANQLAHYLIGNFDIQPDDLVGVYLERNLNYAVALLAVMKARGGCAPINPDLPAERIKTISKNFKTTIDRSTFENLDREKENYTISNPLVRVSPDDLAYVLYTSGSTGVQKAVMLENKGVVNHLFSKIYDLHLNEETILIHTSKMYFVGGIWQLWAPLAVGGKVVIPTLDEIQDISALLSMVNFYQTEIFEIIPSQIANLLALNKEVSLAVIQKLILTGEPLKKDLLDHILSLNPEIEIINTYGQTESSDVTTVYKISNKKPWNHRHVGRPIQNTAHYILDDNMQLCPIGVNGEIYTSGDGTSRGYLNQDDLTNERFLENPFVSGRRMHKTGDIARWTSAGEVRYVGRKDGQVKVRGFRIELGEIEQVLLTKKEVEEAVVIARENQENENELVAYFTATEVQNTNDLRTHLKASLPDYMLPAYFVQLPELPLTNNGKVDKKSLPNPNEMGLSSGVEYVAPRNDLEQQVVQIWEGVLQRKNIGINDDFFALGGHSLKAVRISNSYQKELGVKLSLIDLFANTSVQSHCELIQSCSENIFTQIPLFKLRNEEGKMYEHFPISDAQRRLWVLSQFEEQSAAYNSPSSIYLDAAVDIEYFKKALRSTIDRHEILRTIIKQDESGEIRQWILSSDDLGFDIDYVDFTEELFHLDGLRRETQGKRRVADYIKKDTIKPFDLENGPLFRACLLKVDDQAYVFYFNLHHIISDDWSMDILSRDVMAYYEAYKTNSVPKLNELRIQYKDYAAWQLDQIQSPSYKLHQDYWLSRLGGELGVIDLPSGKRRPRIKTNNGEGFGTYLNAELTNKLREFSQEKAGTTFMGLLAAWNVLMFRYTGQTDVIIGTPVAGRDHADLQDQIGFYVNMLALRNHVDPEIDFNDFYSNVKKDTLEGFSHQMFPFDRLVENLQLLRSTSRNAIFDISITYHTIDEGTEIGLLDTSLIDQIVKTNSSKAKFDIELHFREVEDCLSFNLVYNTDIYTQEMVTNLMVHFKQLLSKLIDNPSEKIADIDFLTTAERQQQIVTFNKTEVDYPKDSSLAKLFEEQTQLSPHQIALTFEEKKLTYQELDALSNQLGHCLVQEYNITSEDVVGIQLDRSEMTIVAILGILKVGATYVPIDPNYPVSRKEHIISDTQIKLLITETNFVFEIDYYNGSIFAIDVEFDPSSYSSDSLETQSNSNHLAYIMYTSGSTGTPKGVMIEQKSIIRLVKNTNFIEVSAGDKVLGLSNFAFDGSTFDIFMPLLNGGELVVAPTDVLMDVQKLNKVIANQDIDSFFITTVLFNSLVDAGEMALSKLKYILVGGEEVSAYHANKFKAAYPNVSLHNCYGPTENTTFSTWFPVDSVEEDVLTISIGSGIANSSVYILDDKNQIVPLGVTGEICVGGAGLARGYLNQEELTKAKFINNPFSKGERLYKTGDLGKWLPEGNIEFIGRKDDQVKVRGYRIELGEIEHAIHNCDGVLEVVLVARAYKGSTEKDLIAYFTADKDLNTVQLRSSLREVLPEYMIPKHIVQLELMPLTSNGKLDKKSLPNPDELDLRSGTEYVAPRNTDEEQLIEIWSELLHLDKAKIGVKEKFFEIGGDSIKVLRLIVAARKKLNYQLAVADIYNNESIEEIVNYVKNHKNELDLKNEEKINQEKTVIREIEELKRRILSTKNSIEKENIEDVYPMSDISKGMVFGYSMNEGNGTYHIQLVYGNVIPQFNFKQFQHALQLLTQKHEILRSSFNLNDFECEVQIVHKSIEIDLPYTDISKIAKAEQEHTVKKYLKAEIDRRFDVNEAPLWRMSVFQLSDINYVFVLQFHHAIIDGWSDASFITELNNLYLKLEEEHDYKPTPLKSSYKDYVIQNKINGADLAVKNFWRSELLEYERLDILTDNEKLERYSHTRNYNYLQKIEEVAKSLNTTVKVVSLSAYLYLLKILNYNTEIVTGVVTNTRPDIEDGDKILGCFLNTVPFKFNVEENLNCEDFIRNVHSKLTSLKNKENLSLQEIAAICREKSKTSNPFFDVFFNYVDFHILNEVVQAESNELVNSGDSKFNVGGYERTNTFFDFIVNTTGNKYNVLIKATKSLKSNLSIEYVGNLYFKIMDAFLENSDRLLKDIDYLEKEERDMQLLTFNGIKQNGEEALVLMNTPFKSVLDLFEEQVLKTPNNVAVVFGNNELSYATVNNYSNQFADYLVHNYNIQTNDLVGIEQERSEWVLITILGVLKSGGAYVPIDPEFPEDRKAFIQSDTACKVCVDSSELDKFKANLHDYLAENRKRTTSENNLAYVIYTSGSSGKPKGVLLEHKGLVNRMIWMKDDLEITEKDVFVQKTPMTFDVSVWELFLPLISGSKLVFAKPGGHKDPQYLQELIADQNISIMHFVPSMLGYALENITWSDLKSVRHVICSGEALPKKIEQIFKAKVPRANLHNYYGPTEASIDVTSINLTENPTVGDEVSIGKPVSNTRIYIVNKYSNILPVGVSGEILIGGVQVARGYLNRDELTKEKFIKSPFKTKERLYKTGDLGRWLPNGNLEFIGRKDDQVKIRGFRIELGEISEALSQNEKVDAAVVVLKELNLPNSLETEKELVAYLTSKKVLNTNDIRLDLAGRLPEYMIPSYFVQLESIPVTSNGKVNRKALPDPIGLGVEAGSEYVAPRNETEKKLTKIWEEVLQREKVGVLDDFFNLGGHSLKALRLGNEYQKVFNVKLSVKDLFSNASLEAHAKIIKASIKAEFVKIPVLDYTDAGYPISDGQRRLWVLSQFDEGSTAYNMSGSIHLDQNINLDCFKRAIDATIQRHEILRTVFKENDDGEVKQFILRHSEVDFKLQILDFRREQDGKSALKNFIKGDSKTAFDLEKGPLMRAALIRVDDQGYVFYYSMHHIVSDAWSMEVLSKDAFAYYEAFKVNIIPELAELKIQYKDYASWQLTQLQEETYKAHRSYWLRNLQGELPLLDLPSSKVRPRMKTNKGNGLRTSINSGTTNKLKELVRENDGSLFMGVLASWNVLFYHYTSQKELLIGTPTSGREHADLQHQIGYYVNTLALRNEVNPDESFNAFFQVLKENTLTSFDHQMYPFDRLVEELNLQRDTGRSAVFDVMINFQNVAENTKNIPTDFNNQIVDRGACISKFDLSITMQELGENLMLDVIFNPDVYELEMVKGLINHYKYLLRVIVENPEQPIGKVDFISDNEKDRLLGLGNQSNVVLSKSNSIVALFEEQVKKSPNNIALYYEGIELTYSELDKQSNQLAHYLKQNYKVCPDDLVGIQQERSHWMLISILAVLKSGAAYVPIEPSYPQSRRDYIKKEANCRLSIDNAELEAFKKTQDSYSTAEIISNVQGSNLAYVIYTSGSTGKPKGVAVEQASLVNYIQQQSHYYGVDQTDRFVLFSNSSFDASIEQIFLPLVNGSALYIPSNECILDTDIFMEYCRNKAITHLHAVPVFLRQLNFQGELPFKRVVSAGEVFNTKVWDELKGKVNVYNKYGPTEITISASILHLSPKVEYQKSISIGTPIGTSKIYILNNELNLQPIGVAGEICVGGIGVARGYLNQPKLTHERFVENPFMPSERMFKTGDIGRWLPDGNIEFIGRKDDQVKIRGFRIELGEIENVLSQHPEIDAAVVVVKEQKGSKEQDADKELVAYVLSGEIQNKADLRAFMHEMLPPYMVPTYFVQLDHFPLKSNGKIDKSALSYPLSDQMDTGSDYVAPNSHIEIELVKIWEQILNREHIGVTDDFFALGGHSLKAVRLRNKYQQQFFVTLSLSDLFKATTIVAHSAIIAASKKEMFLEIPKVDIESNYAISDAQKRLWVLSQMEAGSITYKISGSTRINKNIDIECFKRAILSTIDRHEMLRTVFKLDNYGEIRQWILDKDDFGFEIDYEDFRGAKLKDEAVQNYIEQDAKKAFDLENGPLIKAALLQINTEDFVFYYSLHHIISDAWSMDVLAKDVLAFYEAYKTNSLPNLKELRIQYKDYSAWQLEQVRSESGILQSAFWRQYLNGNLPSLELPIMNERPKFRSYKGGTWSTYINPESSKLLKEKCQQNGGTPFNGLLAAWLILMHKMSGNEDLIIGTSVSGRNHPDLEHQIGFYSNSIALRNRINPNNDFSHILKTVIENTNEAMHHQDYPFNKVVEELNLLRETNRNPIFDNMFVYNTLDNAQDIGGLDFNEFKHLNLNSKFDLEIVVTDLGDAFLFSVLYDAELFEKEKIKRLMINYKLLLKELVDNPTWAIKQIKIEDKKRREIKKANLTKLTSKE